MTARIGAANNNVAVSAAGQIETRKHMLVCDHVEPHRGDEALFWAGPFQTLCKGCHDGAKQSADKSGRTTKGSDISGRPVDPKHPWNAGKPGGVCMTSTDLQRSTRAARIRTFFSRNARFRPQHEIIPPAARFLTIFL